MSAVTAGGGGAGRKLRGRQEGDPSISVVPAGNYGSSTKAETQLQDGGGQLVPLVPCPCPHVQHLHEVITRTDWPGEDTVSSASKKTFPVDFSKLPALPALPFWVSEHHFLKRKQPSFTGAC